MECQNPRINHFLWRQPITVQDKNVHNLKGKYLEHVIPQQSTTEK